MKKVMFVLITLALCVPVWAVNSLTEEFDGPTLTTFSIARGGTFNGSGQYVMTEDDYIYRHVNTGDFNMQLIYNDIDMGNPTTGDNVWNYLINHKGNNSENLVIFFFKNNSVLQFAVDKVISGSSTRVYTETLTSLASATLQVVWSESALEYTISLVINGGAMDQKAVVTGFTASDVNRHEYIYGARTDTEAGKPSFSLDHYAMTAGQTPLGLIESFDDIAGSGWAAQQPSYMIQDTTTYVEGNGSMRVDFPSSQTWWDNWTTLNRDLNLDYATPVQLTFWVKVSSLTPTGDQRVANVTLWDGSSRATRYQSLESTYATTTDWYKVSCPLSGFTPDGDPIDWSDITTLQIKFTTWDTQDPAGSSVWVDDLRLESADAPEPPYQLFSFDDIVGEGWSEVYTTGSMLQNTDPNGQVYEGTGSMRIAFENFSSWNEVPRMNFNPGVDLSMPNLSLSVWVYYDGVGSSRLNQIILYDNNGKYGRYDPSRVTTAGWKQVFAPISGFQWYEGGDSNPIDPNQVNLDNITMMDLWCSEYPDPGNSIYIDDMWVQVVIPCVPTQAVLTNAAYANITVDGNTTDWDGLDSDIIDFNLQEAPTPEDNGDLYVRYRQAWDEDYLYVLIEEQPGDNLTFECPDYATMNDGAGGDVLYDGLALFYDFNNNGIGDAAGSIDIWAIFGLSSTNQTDLLMTWTNGAWGPDKPTAHANASVVTTGTRPSRKVEARLKWTDLAAELADNREPEGGLLAAIQPGFIFGCEPRLADLEGSWGPYDTTKGGAWMNGYLWTPVSGDDIFSIDTRLIYTKADINGDTDIDLLDFAQLAAYWSMAPCDSCNAYCGGADMTLNGSVDINDLAEFAQSWLE